MRKITLLSLFMLLQLLLRAQSIYVCPDTTHVLDPGEFQVCIHVDEQITDFRGYRVVLSYDDDIMTFVEAEQGPVMDGFGSYWWRVFDEGSDSLHIECMGFGAGVSVDGPGSILSMTFHSEVTGITPLHFKEFTLYDVDGLPMDGVDCHDGAVDIKLPVMIPEFYAAIDDFAVFPNPCAGKATISWRQKEPATVELQLLNLQGRVVKSLVVTHEDMGQHHTVLKGDFPPGSYILRLRTQNTTLTKLVIIK